MKKPRKRKTAVAPRVVDEAELLSGLGMRVASEHEATRATNSSRKVRPVRKKLRRPRQRRVA